MTEKNDFFNRVRAVEKELFPEFEECNSNPEIHPVWFYFAPSWHIKSGLLNEDDVNQIVNEEKTLLSVGAGGAYLEQLIVYFGASIDNILLSDLDSSSMPKKFNQVVFDMFEDWSVLAGQKFDYIIFPESVFVFLKCSDKDKESQFWASLIEKSLNHLKVGGIARFSPGNKPPWIIERAINSLKLEDLCFEFERFNNAFGVKKLKDF